MRLLLGLLILLCGTYTVHAQSPTWSWAKKVIQYDDPSRLSNYLNVNVASDDSGNVYLYGTFENEVNIEGTILTASGALDIFIAKFDPAANFLWAISEGDVSNDLISSLTVAKDGKIFISGIFHSVITLGGQQYVSPYGVEGIFVAAYRNNGDFLWARPGFSTDYAETLFQSGIDSQGNFYMPATIVGDIVFGTDTLTGDNDRLFVFKFSPTGDLIWGRREGQSNYQSRSAGIAVFPDGSTMQTGWYIDSITIGTTLLTHGFGHAFLVKRNKNGDVLWARSLKGVSTGMNVSILSDGGFVLTGKLSDNTVFGADTLYYPNVKSFIAKYDSSGNAQWARKNSSEYFVSLVGGGGIITVDSSALINYDASGNVIWSKPYTGNAPSSGALAGNGFLFCGHFWPHAVFENDTLFSSPTENRFIARLDVTSNSIRNTEAQNFALFPNPTTGLLQLRITTPLADRIQVSDLFGRILMTKEISGTSFSIDLSEFPNGQYLLLLSGREFSVQRKLTVYR